MRDQIARELDGLQSGAQQGIAEFLGIRGLVHRIERMDFLDAHVHHLVAMHGHHAPRRFDVVDPQIAVAGDLFLDLVTGPLGVGAQQFRGGENRRVFIAGGKGSAGECQCEHGGTGEAGKVSHLILRRSAAGRI